MSGFNLRRRPRISYFELEEPNLDEYIFCDRCRDYVFEYCSIHGPLLVIPDDKVPARTGFPSFVPRAALTIPHVFLHLAPSIIPGAGLGVFSTLTLPRGVRFGPYRGQRSHHVDSMYCWQIYDRERRPAHVVDAADTNKSNWLRYVNCSRHWREQNLVAFQYQGQLYYRTIKVVPRFTELLVYYGSEFARSLRIDLTTYNFPAGYAQKLGAPLPKKPRLEINKEKHDQEKPPAMTANETGDTATEENVSETVASKASFDLKTTNSGKDKKVTEKLHNDITNKTSKKTPTKTHKSFQCDHCRNRFDSKALLIQHIEITNSQLQRHLRVHSGVKPFSCSQCQYKCTEQSALKSHLRTHTGEKPFSCSQCQYKCTSKSALKIHLRTHTGEKPFSCSQCQYKCTHKCALKIHLRTHTGEKPFSCSQCQYKCTSKSNLNTHLRIHTGEKPFSCSQCQYKCTQKSALKIHLRTHTGEKPFSCSQCQYKYTHKCALKIHLRTHTGEKPFSCSQCQYKCTQKSDLNKHLRMHTGEKPFSCSQCQYKCTQKCDLKIHLRTHTGEKPFSCSQCQYKCIRRSHLKSHISRKHSNGQ